ncbi:MAG: hypothetical protein U9N11_02385, partial [Campylobacterota bacterium]|nr:hypothetical protein [Campylobacterota bacterium]
KLSIFNVMKMVKSKKLKSMEIEEEGKKNIYIILDTETEKEVENSIVYNHDKKDNQSEIELLKKEVVLLKEEIEEIKRHLLLLS